MTNYFDQSNLGQGNQIYLVILTNQLKIGQNDNFTMVATKKYGCFNQSVFTVCSYLLKTFQSELSVRYLGRLQRSTNREVQRFALQDDVRNMQLFVRLSHNFKFLRF